MGTGKVCQAGGMRRSERRQGHVDRMDQASFVVVLHAKLARLLPDEQVVPVERRIFRDFCKGRKTRCPGFSCTHRRCCMPIVCRAFVMRMSMLVVRLTMDAMAHEHEQRGDHDGAQHDHRQDTVLGSLGDKVPPQVKTDE